MSAISIVEAFKTRHSVRTFLPDFPSDKKQFVEETVRECSNIPGPFGTSAEIGVTESGIGKLGFHSNESGWIVLKVPSTVTDNDEYLKYCMDAAFKASIAVMRMIQNGIGTCWVGGTFNRSLVESRFPGYKIPCVACFGIETKKRFLEKVAKAFQNDDRYKFPKIYYDEVAKAPLKTIDGKINELLECIRWLPSAYNNQSWRCTVNANECTFKVFDHYKMDGKYSQFDIGIFLSGFYLYTDGKCSYKVEDIKDEFPSGGKYICTVSIPKELLA